MKWISMAEEKPPVGGNGLLIAVPGWTYSGVYWWDGKRFDDYEHGEPKDEITHWMPLPKPPATV